MVAYSLVYARSGLARMASATAIRAADHPPQTRPITVVPLHNLSAEPRSRLVALLIEQRIATPKAARKKDQCNHRPCQQSREELATWLHVVDLVIRPPCNSSGSTQVRSWRGTAAGLFFLQVFCWLADRDLSASFSSWSSQK